MPTPTTTMAPPTKAHTVWPLITLPWMTPAPSMNHVNPIMTRTRPRARRSGCIFPMALACHPRPMAWVGVPFDWCSPA